MFKPTDVQALAINTIRFLSADAVQQANSGHPGLPMGCAAIAYTIWTRHLRHNPRNLKWPNRDRFILSGGHGSMLLYSLLHLSGYDLSLDELKRFRQWDSRTPGHPEAGLTPGVEVTTGPLGQGLANGVGMALAEAHLAAEFNKPGFPLMDHAVYAIVTDGDLMEGVASEAASFAGHQKLGKLIYVYDDNRITIDGPTDLAFTEDRGARFAAYGWQVLTVADGNDVEAIDAAIMQAKADPRPSLIMARTHIGFGMPKKQDTSKAHGEPPGDDELNAAKARLGWPLEPRFIIPDEVRDHMREAVERGAKLEGEWTALNARYRSAFPDLAAEFSRRMSGGLPPGWETALPVVPADPKGIATRVSSGATINALAPVLPELMGGSADLTPSNNTWIKSSVAFQPEAREGRNIHFGVREHGMGSIANGMALHGGLIPYAATFLVFSDYMRPAIRLSALSHIGSVWIFTHDSIGLGEDGPTHQPVEHLAALRAIPNLVVLRPADANEVSEAWRVAIARRNAPTVLALTRQALPVVDRAKYASAAGLARGAYVLADLGQGKPQILLMASGSEVALVLEAGAKLAEAGIASRVVSFPSWELFAAQDEAYRASVLAPSIRPRVAVEAGVAQGWDRWVGEAGEVIAMNRFGASAPAKVLFEQFGFTLVNVVEASMRVLKR
ncbi:MAG: transketolase [Chloroflexi bacterium RBG_16_64_43]|nr:MAG: transketolase [Chloroflexi bacterium RBG_16_64_43]